MSRPPAWMELAIKDLCHRMDILEAAAGLSVPEQGPPTAALPKAYVCPVCGAWDFDVQEAATKSYCPRCESTQPRLAAWPCNAETINRCATYPKCTGCIRRTVNTGMKDHFAEKSTNVFISDTKVPGQGG